MIWIFKQKRKYCNEIYFIGPHCSGKTESIVAILGLDNNTLPSLSDHSIIKEGIKIIELPPYNNKNDFISRFRLEIGNKYLFFVKNEEELNEYPILEEYNIKYIYWRKSDKKNKKIIYLNESVEKLFIEIKK